jgi:hypothetical protein
MFPPLTPALSPLRGEADATDTPCRSATGGRVPTRFSEVAAASNAVKRVLLSKDAGRAPSPLNGERAGVRGGKAQRLSSNHGVLNVFNYSPTYTP